MKKLTKAISVVLSGLMAVSAFSFAASAANTGSVSTGADPVMTLEERIAAGHQIIYIQKPDDWTCNSWSSSKHFTNLYCKVYAIKGNTTPVPDPSWNSTPTATLKDTRTSEVFYYDLNDPAYGNTHIDEGADYGILMSCGSAQSCDIYFNSDCIGDTLMLNGDGSTRERANNSQESDYLGHWQNHTDYGPLKKISSLGGVLDGMYAPHQPKSDPIAIAMMDYICNPINVGAFTTTKLLSLCESFETTPLEVYNSYVELFGDKLQEKEYVVDDTNPEYPTTAKITKYTHQDGVDDQNADGSLKDVYRYYQEVTTSWTQNARTGVWSSKEATVIYPESEYVMERLGLSEEDVNPTTAEETTVEETTVEETTVEETTEPAPADDYIMIAAGNNSEIFGSAWYGAPDDEANLMEKDGDVYKKAYTVTSSFKNVQAKSVKNYTDPEKEAEWIGDDTGANITFNLTGPGTFYVVYHPDTNLTTVEGDIVQVVTSFEYEYVYAAGNGDGEWLNGAAWDPAFVDNEMTEVADDVWEITYNFVEEGFERQVKFAIDGEWTHNFGFDGNDEAVNFGEPMHAEYNGSNITFDTTDYEFNTIKIQLDLRNFDFKTKQGATYTITITDSTEEPDPEESTAEETTAEETTVEETTVQETTVEETTQEESQPIPDPAPEGNLTLKATSNVFPAAQKSYTSVPDTVSVAYKLQGNNMNIFTYQAKYITWDPSVLKLDSAVFSSADVLQNTVQDGKLVANYSVIANGTAISTKTPLVTLTFTVLNKNAGTTTVDCHMDALAYYENGKEPTVANQIRAVKAGVVDTTALAKASYETVILPEPAEGTLIGDVNSDGKVTVDDVTVLQRYVAKFKGTAINATAADTNGDGKINVRDVTEIQRYLANINTRLVGKKA